MSGSMSGTWNRSYGRATEAPPDERGGNRHARPTATAPRSDSTNLASWFADATAWRWLGGWDAGGVGLGIETTARHSGIGIPPIWKLLDTGMCGAT